MFCSLGLGRFTKLFATCSPTELLGLLLIRWVSQVMQIIIVNTIFTKDSLRKNSFACCQRNNPNWFSSALSYCYGALITCTNTLSTADGSKSHLGPHSSTNRACKRSVGLGIMTDNQVLLLKAFLPC